MSTNRRKFTEEFKADAVQLVVQGQLPIAQVARELEVNESSLGCWVKAYRVQHSDPETPPPPLQPRGSRGWRPRTGGWRRRTRS